MRTIIRKQKHEKIIEVLELIEYAERRIEMKKRALLQYNAMFDPFTNKAEYVRKIQSLEGAKMRVENRYYSLLEEINLIK